MKALCPLLLAALFSFVPSGYSAVTFERLPENGMQPQAITDADGTVHLVWLGGKPAAADVFYQRLPAGEPSKEAPIKVNSHPGSAIAIGTIRGVQIAAGQNGTVHVVWNGSDKAEPKAKRGSPLLYTRLEKGKASFEPERNLMGETYSLDGGGSVAADAGGNVFVFWHAFRGEAPEDESGRRVFLAQSSDSGKTFLPERPVGDPTGACGCCGMDAFSSRSGSVVFALYRAASAMTNRPITLLSSLDHGQTFKTAAVDPWTTATCPMSLAAIGEGPRGAALAWETKGEVFLGTADGGGAAPVSDHVKVSSGKGAKHPAVATNAKGETLAAWTEGTGWQRGGNLAWRIVGSKSDKDQGRMPGISPWNFAAAYSRPDGTFLIVY